MKYQTLMQIMEGAEAVGRLHREQTKPAEAGSPGRRTETSEEDKLLPFDYMGARYSLPRSEINAYNRLFGYCREYNLRSTLPWPALTFEMQIVGNHVRNMHLYGHATAPSPLLDFSALEELTLQGRPSGHHYPSNYVLKDLQEKGVRVVFEENSGAVMPEAPASHQPQENIPDLAAFQHPGTVYQNPKRESWFVNSCVATVGICFAVAVGMFGHQFYKSRTSAQEEPKSDFPLVTLSDGSKAYAVRMENLVLLENLTVNGRTYSIPKYEYDAYNELKQYSPKIEIAEGKNERVVSVEMSKKGLKEVPDKAYMLYDVQKLDLSENQITKLTDIIYHHRTSEKWYPKFEKDIPYEECDTVKADYFNGFKSLRN